LAGRDRPSFIAVVGSKKTGKTTLATFLVHRLVTKGYRVASMKHVHHRGFSIDTPGKDSWRLTKAGSHTVVIISPDEMGQITKLLHASNKQLFPLALQAALAVRPDIVVIDGFASMLRALSHPLVTIVMAKDANDLSASMGRVGRCVFAISGPIAMANQNRSHNEVPIFSYPRERERLFKAISKRLQLT
jgi:molybdopterin-guanine dinucleotide biosynthesis protein B